MMALTLPDKSSIAVLPILFAGVMFGGWRRPGRTQALKVTSGVALPNCGPVDHPPRGGE